MEYLSKTILVISHKVQNAVQIRIPDTDYTNRA